jgi:DNA-binding IclR family transcriptional regulator
MGRAHIVSRTVYAAAKLGLADQLASGPKSAGELASAMDLHALSLYRLMRTLNGWRLLVMEADHHLTEQRRVLRMLGEVVEERNALRFLKARFAGLN